MKIVAVVPAKSKSERIANKNISILDGEYLFKRKLNQLLACDKISEVYLDTDSPEIAKLAKDIPVTVIQRPPHLALNSADGHDIFNWFCQQVPAADIYVQALCTAPFVTESTVGRAIDALLAAEEADSLVAVRRQKQYLWVDGRPAYGFGRIPNSVDLPWTTVEAMSLYIVRRREGEATPSRRFSQRPILFNISAAEDIDINDPADLALAEQFCAGERAAWNAKAAILKPHLSSSLLSDICSEKGFSSVLPPRIRATSEGRILGRVKTLHLTPVKRRDSDDWKGIYKALDSYAFIRPGDVIVCATEVPEKAYFGELNATLAIRAGAVGAVIDGFTRDTQQVRALGLPTYAHGSYCHDIKYEGTLGAMNAPIRIGDVELRNDDVIFADDDGIVVIPSRIWPEICDLAIENFLREARIRSQVIRGMSASEILNTSGEF